MGALKRRKKAMTAEIKWKSKEFSSHIRKKILPQTGIAANDAVTIIALEVAKRIMLGWPVDTGRSRAAWRVIFEQESEVAPGLTSSQTTQGDNLSGRAEKQGRRQGKVRRAFTKKVHRMELVNGVVYAVWLEVGSSQQAPAGVVRKVLAEMQGKQGPIYEEALKRVRG